MATSGICSRSTTWRINSMGHGAPAMMPVRSEERSKHSKSGSSRTARNIVGTPYREVQRLLAAAQLLIADPLALAQQGFPVLVEAEDVMQLGAARPHYGEHGAIGVATEAAAVQQHADARLAQCEFQLGGQVGGIDVDEDGAGAGAGVLDDDPLEAVGGPDADAVAGPDAEGQEAASQARGFVPELAVAGAVVLPADHQGPALGEAVDGSAAAGAHGRSAHRCRGAAG